MDGAGRFDTSFKPIYFETQGSVTDRGVGTGFLEKKVPGGVVNAGICGPF